LPHHLIDVEKSEHFAGFSLSPTEPQTEKMYSIALMSSVRLGVREDIVNPDQKRLVQARLEQIRDGGLAVGDGAFDARGNPVA